MTVTFCGHRTIDRPAEVKSWLEEVVRSLILQGSNKFLLGGYGAFDLMAAHVVHELKAEFPSVESTLVLAYLSTDADLHLYDNSLYPSLENVPPRYAISRRNRWLIENSDVVVAYVQHSWGGAATTLSNAKRKGKAVITYRRRCWSLCIRGRLHSP